MNFSFCILKLAVAFYMINEIQPKIKQNIVQCPFKYIFRFVNAAKLATLWVIFHHLKPKLHPEKCVCLNLGAVISVNGFLSNCGFNMSTLPDYIHNEVH